MRVPTIADADELVPRILNLTSRTEGVSVKVTGELNRPPYEKSNAGARCYEHAKALAAEIGFELSDTLHRRRLRRQFHRASHRNPRRPRGRWKGRAYPLRADVYFIDRAAERGCCIGCTRRCDECRRSGDPGNRDASSGDAAAVHPQGSFFGRRKGHRLRAHQADLIEHLLPRLSLDIAGPPPPDLAGLFDRAGRCCQARNRIWRRRASGRGSPRLSEHRLHRLRALCQRHGEDPGADRGP